MKYTTFVTFCAQMQQLAVGVSNLCKARGQIFSWVIIQLKLSREVFYVEGKIPNFRNVLIGDSTNIPHLYE